MKHQNMTKVIDDGGETKYVSQLGGTTDGLLIISARRNCRWIRRSEVAMIVKYSFQQLCHHANIGDGSGEYNLEVSHLRLQQKSPESCARDD
jgi:hypothetical protein